MYKIYARDSKKSKTLPSKISASYRWQTEGKRSNSAFRNFSQTRGPYCPEKIATAIFKFTLHPHASFDRLALPLHAPKML